MNKTKARIPEGGAIEDAPELSMEQYSELIWTCRSGHASLGLSHW